MFICVSVGRTRRKDGGLQTRSGGEEVADTISSLTKGKKGGQSVEAYHKAVHCERLSRWS